MEYDGLEKAHGETISTNQADVASREQDLGHDGSSDHPDDPLNFPRWRKTYIAFLISFIGFTAQMGSALINPSFVQMSKDLDVTVEQASYSTTVCKSMGEGFIITSAKHR